MADAIYLILAYEAKSAFQAVLAIGKTASEKIRDGGNRRLFQRRRTASVPAKTASITKTMEPPVARSK